MVDVSNFANNVHVFKIIVHLTEYLLPNQSGNKEPGCQEETDFCLYYLYVPDLVVFNTSRIIEASAPLHTFVQWYLHPSVGNQKPFIPCIIKLWSSGHVKRCWLLIICV